MTLTVTTEQAKGLMAIAARDKFVDITAYMQALVVVALLVAGVVSGLAVGTFETVTVADTAIGLTSTTYAPTGRTQMTNCTARVESANIRIRVDGTAPTASVGLLVSAGDVFNVDGNADLATLKMIRTGSTSATVTFLCWAK